MEFLYDYGLFLAKTATLVLALLVVIGTAAATAMRGRNRSRDRLELSRLNDRYRDRVERIEGALTPHRPAWRWKKRAATTRQAGSKDTSDRPRLFILDFRGDLRASATESLREEISAILTAARPQDRVLLRLESTGGLVHNYGLAASQLIRLRERGIHLTVSIDRVAASGGYLMASVADRLIAAPFAIVGSIGVIAQVPNFHRVLKKHEVDFELHTAGEFKRTLTLFGENTDAARAKFREELAEVHQSFKDHIARYRPNVEINRIATGEYWLGERARELGLVDELGTSDDFILTRLDTMELISLRFRPRERITRRLALGFESLLRRLMEH
ncbi:MAG: protease SohB [Nitrococcus mobilis]|nr:protease SohB [Nitrococcus mobilis]